MTDLGSSVHPRVLKGGDEDGGTQGGLGRCVGDWLEETEEFPWPFLPRHAPRFTLREQLCGTGWGPPTACAQRRGAPAGGSCSEGFCRALSPCDGLQRRQPCHPMLPNKPSTTSHESEHNYSPCEARGEQSEKAGRELEPDVGEFCKQPCFNSLAFICNPLRIQKLVS